MFPAPTLVSDIPDWLPTQCYPAMLLFDLKTKLIRFRIDLLFSLIWKITILNNFENSSHRRKNLQPFKKWGYFQSFWLFWPLFDQILHSIGNEQIKVEYHSCLWHKTTKQPILLSFYEFFSVCAVEKENNLYIGPKLKKDWTNEKFILFLLKHMFFG